MPGTELDKIALDPTQEAAGRALAAFYGALDAKADVMQRQSAVQALVDGFHQVVATAEQSIVTARETALSQIESKELSVLQGIATKEEEALSDIQSARTSALSALDTNKASAISEINSTKDSGVSAVNTAKNTGLTEIASSKSTALGEISGAQTTGVNAINSAKSSGLQEIADSVSTAMGNISSAVSSFETFAAQTVTTVTNLRNETTAARDTAVTAKDDTLLYTYSEGPFQDSEGAEFAKGAKGYAGDAKQEADKIVDKIYFEGAENDDVLVYDTDKFKPSSFSEDFLRKAPANNISGNPLFLRVFNSGFNNIVEENQKSIITDSGHTWEVIDVNSEGFFRTLNRNAPAPYDKTIQQLNLFSTNREINFFIIQDYVPRIVFCAMNVVMEDTNISTDTRLVIPIYLNSDNYVSIGISSNGLFLSLVTDGNAETLASFTISSSSIGRRTKGVFEIFINNVHINTSPVATVIRVRYNGKDLIDMPLPQDAQWILDNPNDLKIGLGISSATNILNFQAYSIL